MSAGDDSALFSGRDLVCIHRGTDPIEASLLQGLLESEGVPATITGADLVGGYSGVPRVCDVRLLVPRRYGDAATNVLQRYENERGRTPGDDWRCPACSEVNGANFEACWACGREPTASP